MRIGTVEEEQRHVELAHRRLLKALYAAGALTTDDLQQVAHPTIHPPTPGDQLRRAVETYVSARISCYKAQQRTPRTTV